MGWCALEPRRPENARGRIEPTLDPLEPKPAGDPLGVADAVLRAETQRQQVGSPRLPIGRDQQQARPHAANVIVTAQSVPPAWQPLPLRHAAGGRGPYQVRDEAGRRHKAKSLAISGADFSVIAATRFPAAIVGRVRSQESQGQCPTATRGRCLAAVPGAAGGRPRTPPRSSRC